MYDELRYFAFEDIMMGTTNVAMSSLIKFYSESLQSPHGIIRQRVARHLVDLVMTEDDPHRPAFHELQSAFRNGHINCRSRKRITELLGDVILASLDI